MSVTISIYALCDPLTNKPRYVGQALHPRFRLHNHVSQARSNRSQSAKNLWLAEVLESGLKPVLSILEEVPEPDAAVREQFWVDHLRAEGHELLNDRPTRGPGHERVRSSQRQVAWHLPEELLTNLKEYRHEHRLDSLKDAADRLLTEGLARWRDSAKDKGGK